MTTVIHTAIITTAVIEMVGFEGPGPAEEDGEPEPEAEAVVFAEVATDVPLLPQGVPVLLAVPVVDLSLAW